MGCAGRKQTAGKGMESVNQLSGKFSLPLVNALTKIRTINAPSGVVIKEIFE